MRTRTHIGSILALGVITGYSAILLATPFLTRLYNPEEFGSYAMLISTLSVLAPIAALRFELSIPIPKIQHEAWHAFVLSNITTCLFALLLVGVVNFWPHWISKLIGLPDELTWLIWALPIGILLSGLQQSLRYWNIRNSQFLKVSQSHGSYGVITAGSQLAMGSSGFGAAALIGGEIIGRIFSCLLLTTSTHHSGSHKYLRATTSIKILAQTARTFQKFAFISAPSSLINALSIYLPVLMIGHFISLQAAGLILLAQRVIGLPTSLLVSSTSQVFVSEFSRLKTSSQRTHLYVGTLKRFALLTAPIFLIIGIMSPNLFPLIFGDDWAESGLLSMILAPFFFMQLLSGTTVSALDILQAHWIRLARELVFLTGTLAIILTSLHYNFSTLIIVSAYAIFGAIFYLSSLIVVHRIILKSEEL